MKAIMDIHQLREAFLQSMRPVGVTDEEWDSRSFGGYKGGRMTTTKIDEDLCDVQGKCVMTGIKKTVRVRRQGIWDWINEKATIQTALKDVSENDRSFLLDGIVIREDDSDE